MTLIGCGVQGVHHLDVQPGHGLALVVLWAGLQRLQLLDGLEWMRAGGGTWHQGFIHPHEETALGFRLWVALPPGVEDGPSEGTWTWC